MREIRRQRTVLNLSEKPASQDNIFVDASMAAIKQIIVPKMELEAAVIGMRLEQLNKRETTLTFDKFFL